jgi:hypothetical protein
MYQNRKITVIDHIYWLLRSRLSRKKLGDAETLKLSTEGRTGEDEDITIATKRNCTSETSRRGEIKMGKEVFLVRYEIYSS